MISESAAVRRESNLSVPRRPSEVSRRESEVSRKESVVSTTIGSDVPLANNNDPRKNSLSGNQAEWRPNERDAPSNAQSLASSRRTSFNSETGSRRPSVDDDATEISFGNGEFTNVSSRRASPSPTAGLRKLSITSSTSSTQSVVDARPSESKQGEIPRRPSNSALSPPLSPTSTVLLAPPSPEKPVLTNDLPPLPPADKSKRLGGLLSTNVRPKVATKLRSMIKRASSDRVSDKDLDEATDQVAETISEARSSEQPRLDESVTNGHYNEFDSPNYPVSPGRARIYTVEQARRGSFLPINKLPSSDGSPLSGRRSVRLSEADVGFLLGKFSRISSDTLRQAAIEGNSSLCEALVRGSVAVDEADLDGKTALMLAAENGRGDTTGHLLVLGATVDLKEENGKTALYFAVVGTKVSCVKALVNYGADCNLVVSGDSIFTTAFLSIETSLDLPAGEAKSTSYAQTCEVCRVMVKASKAHPSVRREKLRKPTLFLLDEWVRAKDAGEGLVIPPMDKLVEGEKTLINFLKQHRQRVNVIATIKIWFVMVFIGFDLAAREMAMTPVRILTYVVLYIGAYYL